MGISHAHNGAGILPALWRGDEVKEGNTFSTVRCGVCRAKFPVKECRLYQWPDRSSVMWKCPRCRGLAPESPGEAPLAFPMGDLPLPESSPAGAAGSIDHPYPPGVTIPVRWEPDPRKVWGRPETAPTAAAKTVEDFAQAAMLEAAACLALMADGNLPLADIREVSVRFEVRVNRTLIYRLFREVEPAENRTLEDHYRIPDPEAYSDVFSEPDGEE